jgi:hypothetical protein
VSKSRILEQNGRKKMGEWVIKERILEKLNGARRIEEELWEEQNPWAQWGKKKKGARGAREESLGNMG